MSIQEQQQPPKSPALVRYEYIQAELAKRCGNKSATCRDLGMHRRTLQRILAKRPPHR
jgi:two-component system response regulator RegA